jgi:hypothetical protein
MTSALVFIGLLGSLLVQDGRATATSSQKPSPALRIVVIAGEDAINVIQQKTAVAPIIEVRDRNSLPVAGATVTFTVGPGATFGGASTLTVATNAAGQAAATGLTPTAAGAIQVQATAVFQGQTAIATIAQSNVLTAAQAAAATGATSGATTGGTSGGGISGTTIGIAGAAVGAVAIGAAVAGGGADSTPVTTPPVTTPVVTTSPSPPTTVTYQGQYAAQYSQNHTYSGCAASIAPTCGQNLSESGTLRVTLTRGAGDAVTGNAQLTANTTTSGTCFQTTTYPIGWTYPVNGSVQQFGFDESAATTFTVSGTPIGTSRYVLRASVANGVVSGTVTIDYALSHDPAGSCSTRTQSRHVVSFSLQ